ncbi:MAG: PEGA domain-containing protein [Patescibacteria group bacterium]|mgnify:CR=1 FL=1
MHRRVRNGIFFVFLTIFVIGAPVIVLYTAGYRLNFSTWRVQRTGVIAITTLPRGASVTMNNQLIAEKTPYVAQRLTPGDYDVLLQKSGYQSWSQHVDVGSGSTTYITALLFSDTKPELLLEESALSVVGDKGGRFVYLLVANGDMHEVWRYDTVTRLQRLVNSDVGNTTSSIALTTDESTLLIRQSNQHASTSDIGISADTGTLLSATDLATATNALPEFSLFDNGSNVEMRLTSTDELITLLPPSTYTVAFRNSTIAILKDTRDRAYLVDLRTNIVSQIDLATTLLSESSTENLLAASDGNEIDVYSPQTGERTFIARQSDPILALTWHSSDRALFFATGSKIVAIERDKYETRETTTLVDDASIVNMWPDTTGKSLTFFGTVNGITGIWKLALTQ